QANETYKASTTAIYLANGTTLNYNGGELLAQGLYSAQAISAEGTSCQVNICGGTITTELTTKDISDRYAAGAIAVNANAATVNLSGGILYTQALITNNYGVKLSNNATFTMNGGVIDTSTGNDDTDTFCSTYCVYSSNSSTNISAGTLLATSLTSAYTLYYTGSKGRTDVTGGHFLANAGFNTHFIINSGINPANISITGGYFNRETNLKEYIGNKYLCTIASNTSEYEQGLRYTLTDTNPIQGVAQNLTTGTFYPTLEQALEAAVANDTISLTEDYTLKNNATVKPGVMLLIPFDIANTCFTTSAEAAYPRFFTGEAFRTLKIENGAVLTIDGELSVSAMQSSPSGGVTYGTGSPYGKFGLINMDEGTQIVANGNVYCYGYIAGKGKVIMQKDTKLYEDIQFFDWRGGNRTSSYFDKVFLFNQYAVQNVEAEVIFMPGSQNITSTNLNGDYTMVNPTDIDFLGPDEAIFTTHDNTIVTRHYNPETDCMTYDFDGDVTLGSITFSIFGLSLSSSDYDMYLTNNYTVNVKNGTLTLPYSYTLLPGAEINIDKSAAMIMAADKHLTIFDKDNWDIYALNGYIVPVDFTIANGFNNRNIRTAGGNLKSNETLAKMTDAKLNINGTLTAGQMYTTLGGANICSSEGTGTIILASDYTNDVDSIPMVNGYDFQPTSVPVVSMLLTNNDGTTIDTAGEEQGTQFIYKDGVWEKYVSTVVLPGDANNDGDISVADLTMLASYILGNSPEGINLKNADVNGDSEISVADLTSLSSLILDNNGGTPKNPGDANGDGVISVADLTMVAAYILGDTSININIKNADMNNDGIISVADLTSIAALILNAQ
ncbi:MAG: dockerin type I repeat-containing protein, partial [Bacteroidales bacterium]|nr:dockerin type I repeat-containing protein [Bacteroidales bacterium]